MSIELQEKDESKVKKPRFIFEEHNLIFKREPVKEVLYPAIDLDAVKTEEKEPNQDKNCIHYTITSVENGDVSIMPLLVQNNFPDEIQNVVIKTEMDEPLIEIDIKENIAKDETMPFVTDVTHNLNIFNNSNSIVKIEDDKSTPIILEESYSKKPKHRKEFPTKHSQYLKIHPKDHHIMKTFPCNLCKHKTFSSAKLNRHLKKFHNKESLVFNCHHCKSSFTQKNHLIAHLKTQSDNYTSRYNCSKKNYFKNNKYNDFTFDYDAYVSKEQKYTNKKLKTQTERYECTICPFECTQKKHLKMIAKKSQTVQKHHSCQYCKFKTTTLVHLEQHMRKKHQNEKPYFCKLCDCTYSLMNDLVKHIKSHFSSK